METTETTHPGQMLVNEEHTIFYEKYKPQRVQDLVLPELMLSKLQKFIDDDDVPNMGFFSANPGTGKSSTANAIIKNMECESLWINGSLERSIDLLRGKLQKFAESCSFDDRLKIVVVDEFDYFSKDGMAAFRGFLDDYSATCRFIFTGNYKEKIIKPLLDRLEVFDYNNMSKKEMVKPIYNRLDFILKNENIEYNPQEIATVINTYYPSIRSMVGAIQKHSINGKFTVTQNDLDGMDTYGEIVKKIKEKDYTSVVEMVNELNSPSNFYTYLYKKIDTHYTQQQKIKVITIIAEFQYKSAQVRDEHLILSACCATLMNV